MTNNSTETRDDLAYRLGKFARAMFVISVGMLVASVTLNRFIGPRSFEANFLNPARWVHFAATALVLVVWRVCHSPNLRLSVRTIEILDAIQTIGLCTCWALLGVWIPRQEPIEFSIVLAMTYTIIARSVAIPSSFTRTFLVSIVGIVPVIAVFSHRAMGFVTEPSLNQLRTFIGFTGLWCVLAVVTAALNSRQLYGLREVIKEIGKLGQYTLEGKLGEGGMGVVHRATHAMLRRNAAIKLLLPDRTGASDLARFEREVQLTSQLAHPNTVSIFDYGRTADNTFYYVMEFIDGLDLEQLVEAEGGPIEPPRAIHILMQAAGSLSEAHQLGLIHRDIKPANIMLTQRADEADVVKVVDFGLAKTVSKSDSAALSVANSGAITDPDGIDARADIYALGAVAYFLLTGEHVFTGKSVLEVCGKHLHEQPITPSERAGRPLPSDLEELVLLCLEKDRKERPSSSAELLENLRRCAEQLPYNAQDATRWWTTHKSRMPKKAEDRARLETAETMTIDFQNRQPES